MQQWLHMLDHSNDMPLFCCYRTCLGMLQMLCETWNMTDLFFSLSLSPLCFALHVFLLLCTLLKHLDFEMPCWQFFFLSLSLYKRPADRTGQGALGVHSHSIHRTYGGQEWLWAVLSPLCPYQIPFFFFVFVFCLLELWDVGHQCLRMYKECVPVSTHHCRMF